MTPLPLLLALALAADPEAAPAAPPEPPAAAPAAEEPEAPQVVVAPEVLPEPAPAEPAPPFVLTGFQPDERVVVGASLRLGGSSRGFDGGAEFTLRHRGFVGGVTTGGAAGGDTLRTLGLVAGYAQARGRYRGEALLGWGVASDRRDEAGVTTSRVGHFRALQAGLERAVCGGDTWRAALGAALWWRQTFGLATAPTSHAEVGGGLKLAVETGW